MSLLGKVLKMDGASIRTQWHWHWPVFTLVLALCVNSLHWVSAPQVPYAHSSAGNESARAFSTSVFNQHWAQDQIPASNFMFTKFFDAFRQNLQQQQQRTTSTMTPGSTSTTSVQPNLNTNLSAGTPTEFPGYEDNRGRRPKPDEHKKPYVLPNPPTLSPGWHQPQQIDSYGPPSPGLAIANSQRLIPPSVPVTGAPVNGVEGQELPISLQAPILSSNQNSGFGGGFSAELLQLAGPQGNVGEDSGGGGGDPGEEVDTDEDPQIEVQPLEPEFRNPPPSQGRQAPVPGPGNRNSNSARPEPEPEPEIGKIPLGPLNVYPDAVTLSGFSSGGAFVQQLLVAHPSMFTGIGIFHQTFYRCGGGGGLVQDFDFFCTQLPSNYTRRRVPYDPKIAVRDIEMYGMQGLIENPSHLKGKRLYIYGGLMNEVFTIEMQMSIIKVLEPFIGDPELVKTRVQNAQNSLPTRHYGLPCDQPATNNFLVGNCNLDGAYESISWLYGPDVIQRPEPAQDGQPGYDPHSLLQFDQSEFFQGINSQHHMANTGFVYIPHDCTQHGATCLLHAYFHGCRTGSDYVGSNHIRNSGYLELAELNNIVMLFPQVARTQVNYLGCWDSFGNTGEFYATQRGPQIIIVKRMIERILGIGPAPAPIQPQQPPQQALQHQPRPLQQQQPGSGYQLTPLPLPDVRNGGEVGLVEDGPVPEGPSSFVHTHNHQNHNYGAIPYLKPHVNSNYASVNPAPDHGPIPIAEVNPDTHLHHHGHHGHRTFADIHHGPNLNIHTIPAPQPTPAPVPFPNSHPSGPPYYGYNYEMNPGQPGTHTKHSFAGHHSLGHHSLGHHGQNPGPSTIPPPQLDTGPFDLIAHGRVCENKQAHDPTSLYLCQTQAAQGQIHGPGDISPHTLAPGPPYSQEPAVDVVNHNYNNNYLIRKR